MQISTKCSAYTEIKKDISFKQFTPQKSLGLCVCVCVCVFAEVQTVLALFEHSIKGVNHQESITDHKYINTHKHTRTHTLCLLLHCK